MYHDTVADDAGTVATVYLAFCDVATSNGAHLRDLVHLAHLHLTGDNLLLHLVEHTDHSRLDVVDSVVDDRVGVDFYAFLLSQLACCGRRAHLEAHDDSVGSIGECNVALRDLTYCLVDNVHLDLLCRHLDERVGESLDRAVGVTLNDDVKLLERTEGDAVRDIREGETLLCAQALLALQLQTLVGDVACLLLGVEHVERVAGCRRTVQAEDDSWLSRTCRLYALVALVEHGLDAAP